MMFFLSLRLTTPGRQVFSIAWMIDCLLSWLTFLVGFGREFLWVPDGTLVLVLAGTDLDFWDSEVVDRDEIGRGSEGREVCYQIFRKMMTHRFF